MKTLALGLAVAFLLSGCLARLTGDHYERHEARVAQDVSYGTVEELRLVVIEGTKSHVGPVVGAIIGGVAGREVGDGNGRRLARVVGATAGGVAGAAIEEAATRRQGVEITVRLHGGHTIAVVQEIDPAVDWHTGDRVRVLSLGRNTRVIPDPG